MADVDYSLPKWVDEFPVHMGAGLGHALGAIAGQMIKSKESDRQFGLQQDEFKQRAAAVERQNTAVGQYKSAISDKTNPMAPKDAWLKFMSPLGISIPAGMFNSNTFTPTPTLLTPSGAPAGFAPTSQPAAALAATPQANAFPQLPPLSYPQSAPATATPAAAPAAPLAPPAPSSPTGAMPGFTQVPNTGGTYNGRYIPPQYKKNPQAQIIPHNAIGILPSGERVTNSLPNITRREGNVVLTPGSELHRDGQPTVTNMNFKPSIPAGAGRAKSAPEPLKEGEVIRTTKDGKKAVFDEETKKFLRYAD